MIEAIYRKYGPSEVVKSGEADRPAPGSDEVSVKVYATTVNRTDCGFRSSEYLISRLFSGLFKPECGIPANKFAGAKKMQTN